MSIPGKVQKAPPGAKGFDCNTQLHKDKDLVAKFRSQGYQFCLRYISRKAEDKRDLCEEEVRYILEGGLALMPVQHVLKEGWLPSEELGREYGEAAGRNAKNVGFPDGVCVWCDLEGVKQPDKSLSKEELRERVIAYCNAWYDAVDKAGYAPGLYVGAKCGLSSKELYYKLRFSHYWKSGSKVPDVAVRGYQMIQSCLDIQENGIGIDRNATQTDNKGDTVIWLAPDNAIS